MHDCIWTEYWIVCMFLDLLQQIIYDFLMLHIQYYLLLRNKNAWLTCICRCYIMITMLYIHNKNKKTFKNKRVCRDIYQN